MPNPIFSDKNFRAGGRASATLAPVGWHPPVDDGPTTRWPTATERMSVGGVVSATGWLLALLLI